MRILVVHAHPVAESFSHALFERVCGTLEARRHTVDALDLYAISFEPRVGREERLLYEDTIRARELVAAHVEQLEAAQGLIFVYPTWWYGLPAMLKGWLDRVWLPGVAFSMPQDDKPIGRLLTRIKIVGGVSTYGAPWWFTRWVGDPGRRTIMRGVKPLCAKGCRSFWLAHYLMDSSTPESRETFLRKVEARIARI